MLNYQWHACVQTGSDGEGKEPPEEVDIVFGPPHMHYRCGVHGVAWGLHVMVIQGTVVMAAFW